MESVRVTKLMSMRGICSRREAERYIDEGRVFVDGEAVKEQGVKASPSASITLNQEGLLPKRTIILHKPLGIISNLPVDGYQEALSLITLENQQGSALEEVPSDLHVVGRLDVNSKGLLLLTEDGQVAKAVIGPESEMEKEYVVRFQEPVPKGAIEKLSFGLSLDGERLKRAKIKMKDPTTFIFILREGKKRQIRRMCEKLDLPVTSLKRVRIGSVQLASLPVGKWRALSSQEVQILKAFTS